MAADVAAALLLSMAFALPAAGSPAFEMRDARVRTIEAPPDERNAFELRGRFRVERPTAGPAQPFVLVPASTKTGIGCGAPIEGRIFADGFEGAGA